MTFHPINYSVNLDNDSEDVAQDMKLLQEINELFRQNTMKQQTNSLVDETLAKNVNWFDPDGENYVDPFEDSQTRLSLIALIDKFRKKILVINTDQPHRFFVPGGRPKVFEASHLAAIRNFYNLTKIKIESDKLTELLIAKIDPKLTVTTYVSFVCNNGMPPVLLPGVHWVPIVELNKFRHPAFKAYYSELYITLFQYLY